MDRGFGYNRASTRPTSSPATTCCGRSSTSPRRAATCCSTSGPRGEDAQIPDEQLDRLGWLAERAGAHGASVAGTRPWVRPRGAARGPRRPLHRAPRTVWAHLWPADGSESSAPRPTVTLPFRATPATTVTDAAGKALVFQATNVRPRSSFPPRSTTPCSQWASTTWKPWPSSRPTLRATCAACTTSFRWDLTTKVGCRRGRGTGPVPDGSVRPTRRGPCRRRRTAGATAESSTRWRR